MAQYWAKALLYVDRLLIKPGEQFESDLPPGRNWVPIDDEAKERCAARDQARAPLYSEQAKLDAPGPAAAAVPIPEDWLEQRPQNVIGLARRLGARPTCNFTQAVAWIEKTITARAHEAANMQGAA